MGVQAPDLQEVPPPPPPGAASQSAGQPDFSAAGVSAMSVAAAKAAAARAAAAIQQQLHGMGSGADVNSKYPGMPPAWGVGMTEAQRDTAYAQHTRQSRRLYVGSLPKPVTDEALHAFFNDAMVNSGAAIDPSGGPSVVNTTITHEKGFAFIEFRRLEDAESALMFDGIVFNGSKLVIKRPKDYDAARNPIWAMRGQAPPQDEVKLIGEELPIGTIIVDGKEVKIPLPPPLPSEWPRLPRRTPNGPHKMYCGGFHPLHTDLQVRQVLQSVGELRSFAVMPDKDARPTGHAFFEYKDPRLSAVAETVLTGIRVRNRRLVCRRMNPDAAPEKPGESARRTSSPTRLGRCWNRRLPGSRCTWPYARSTTRWRDRRSRRRCTRRLRVWRGGTPTLYRTRGSSTTRACFSSLKTAGRSTAATAAAGRAGGTRRRTPRCVARRE